MKRRKGIIGGVVEPDLLYTRAAAMTALSLGRDAFRAAVRRGLRVRRHGCRVFVLGRDLIAYLDGPGGEAATPGRKVKDEEALA